MTEILELLGIAVIPAFLLVDLAGGARPYPGGWAWRLRALGMTLVTFATAVAVTLGWAAVFGDRHLLDLSGLGTWAGAGVGVLVSELLQYGYHRAVHRWDFLWRRLHLMHHSAETLDAFGANWIHPLDNAFFTTWGSLTFFPLLGLTPEAGAAAALFITFNALFQHTNKRTPHWLGYLIQRPESHAVHHGRGIHRWNYSDLPVLDMIFGTFRNPRSVEGLRAGFYDGASDRVWDMLVWRDVSRPRPAPCPPAWDSLQSRRPGRSRAGLRT